MKSYFDYASGCPVDERVLKAMLPYFKNPGNPSSVHSYGYQAKKALDESRDFIAKLIGSESNEIVFTSGATEARWT